MTPRQAPLFIICCIFALLVCCGSAQAYKFTNESDVIGYLSDSRLELQSWGYTMASYYVLSDIRTEMKRNNDLLAQQNNLTRYDICITHIAGYDIRRCDRYWSEP